MTTPTPIPAPVPVPARVTATVLEMQQAGWCQPVDATTWQLTAAGQAILRGTPK